MTDIKGINIYKKKTAGPFQKEKHVT